MKKLVNWRKWPLSVFVRCTQPEPVSFVLHQLGNLVRNGSTMVNDMIPETDEEYMDLSKTICRNGRCFPPELRK